ncbi:protein cortex [Contarinia nasturtii]|uniref:protein cortex n=1 Tax=Contarinia nasturtii TaxID=265458 RepID=UPI0012D44FED|nr:protein cortex [Contarinia nasturtii]
MSVIISQQYKTKQHNVRKAGNIEQVEVKKRVQYENEIIRGKSRVKNVPTAYGDRFIPRRRQSAEQIFYNSSFNREENENDIFYIKAQPFYWRRTNYRINIKMQLGINFDRDLLNFHDPTTKQMCERSFNRNPTQIEYNVPSKSTEELDWSCRPRSKPLSYSDSIHDMPGFDRYESGNNIVDWSSAGEIAAVFDSSLVLWSPETNPIEFELKNINALKFGPNDKLLALGTKNFTPSSSLLQICEITSKQLIRKGAKKFLEIPKNITSIEWERNGCIIACGTSTGMVFIVSYPEMKIEHRFKALKTAISNMKYSIRNTFIAINSSNDGNLLILYNKKFNFEQYLAHENVYCIAWHPWIETNLFIGYKSPASIHLMDLKTKTMIAHYRRNDLQYSLCAMSINPLSAELVVSFSHQENDVTHSDILVMASMNSIVDNISAHQEAVYFILWDPTGTKVATIGQDESLNIWHFFGKSQKKADELKKMKENKNQPMCSNFNLNNVVMQSR